MFCFLFAISVTSTFQDKTLLELYNGFHNAEKVRLKRKNKLNETSVLEQAWPICHPIGQDSHQMGVNLKLFKIRFIINLARWAKMNGKLILKSLRLVPFGANMTQLDDKSGPPVLELLIKVTNINLLLLHCYCFLTAGCYFRNHV